MPVAVAYSSAATASASECRPGRMRRSAGATSEARRFERRGEALLERGRLEPELLLRLRRARRGVPEEEVELPPGEHRPAPEHAGPALARRRQQLRDRHRDRRWHEPAPGDADRRLGELPQRYVPVGEDGALAVASPLRGEQVAARDRR